MRVWAGLMLVLGFGLVGVATVEARVPVQDAVQEASAPAAASAPVITDGAQAFQAAGCAHCHAINGVGGHKGPDLSGTGRRSKRNAIEAQIVKGSDAMPEFGDVLPAAEIEALVTYLHKQRAKTPAWPRGPVVPLADPKVDDSPGE